LFQTFEVVKVMALQIELRRGLENIVPAEQALLIYLQILLGHAFFFLTGRVVVLAPKPPAAVPAVLVHVFTSVFYHQGAFRVWVAHIWEWVQSQIHNFGQWLRAVPARNHIFEFTASETKMKRRGLATFALLSVAAPQSAFEPMTRVEFFLLVRQNFALWAFEDKIRWARLEQIDSFAVYTTNILRTFL
jgi:hypothetical protein